MSTTPAPARHDRRNHRSAYVPHALRLQLEHVARVLELRAIALTDDLGLPLAVAGDAALSQLLADAVLWSRDDRDEPFDPHALELIQAHDPRLSDLDVASMPLQVGEQELHLVAVGTSRARYIGLEHAAQGIQRIMAAPRA